jgi:hypothetical protein
VEGVETGDVAQPGIGVHHPYYLHLGCPALSPHGGACPLG